MRQRIESNAKRGNPGLNVPNRPDRPNAKPERIQVNRPDFNRDNNRSRPGNGDRQMPKDVRDVFQRNQPADRNRPDAGRGQTPGRPDKGATPSLQDRLRDMRENPRGPSNNRFQPGNMDDIRNRLRDLNRGQDSKLPKPSDRNRGPQAERDNSPRRPDMENRDRPDFSKRPPIGDRPGANRPNGNRPDNNQLGNRKPNVRPDFDWRDRSQRDPKFRENLQEVQRRGSLDRDKIRNQLVTAEKHNRDHGGHYDRHPNGKFDRNWDGRWGKNDWHHVPNNWYRHASNVRNNSYRHFHYGWNNNWRPNNRYLNNWFFFTYTPRPGYWWSWGSPYRLSTCGFWGSYPTYPVYYDYGTTVVYDTQYIYVQDEPIATREQYALQAIALANEGRQQLQSRPPIQGNGSPEDWLPLGVFVLTDTETGDGSIYLQLAVDKDGLIAGTYYNATTGNSLPIWGKVDPATQRVAWMIGETSSTVMETGIYNLSQEASSVLVHYGTQRDETWMLVRLPEDRDENQLP
ncbi:hypothetical protein DTL42_07530 [Bremerella cremea]|uniref:Uncharacterized protein n=2 Tax=Bremerella cremea TaxID=1031537 RepID=A0A368KUW6_9BACT|nr:hypothetical protein DTL42_07530 [Bremerella cremea]